MRILRIVATVVATAMLIGLIAGQPSAAPTVPVYVGVHPGAVPPVVHRVDAAGRIVTDSLGQPAAFPNPDRRPVNEPALMGTPAYCPAGVNCKEQ